MGEPLPPEVIDVDQIPSDNEVKTITAQEFRRSLHSKQNFRKTPAHRRLLGGGAMTTTTPTPTTTPTISASIPQFLGALPAGREITINFNIGTAHFGSGTQTPLQNAPIACPVMSKSLDNRPGPSNETVRCTFLFNQVN